MGIILAILIFGIIVFIHEMGHFLLAKMNGIAVEEFAIGMGPKIIGRRYKGTLYAWRLFPIGGACVMGEDDADDQSEGSFNSKSVWARISVIAAGPIFNFILAFILSVIIVGWVGYDEPVIGTVSEGLPAEAAGLEPGDKIIKMNGKRIHIFREILVYNQYHQGEDVTIEYERDGKKEVVDIKPQKGEEDYYLIGISAAEIKKANPITAMKYGAYEVKYWIDMTVGGLKQLVTGSIGVDQLSGPVGIVDMVGDTYQESKSSGIASTVLSMLNIAILLTANLGVMNLVPFPALDGGRLVFLIIEAIRGKRIPPQKEGLVHMIGMFLLFGVMILVFFQDIRRLFF